MFGMACVTVFVMLLLHTIEQNCIEGKEHLNIVVIFYLNANNVITDDDGQDRITVITNVLENTILEKFFFCRCKNR